MSGRGRRLATLFLILAGILAGGRWAAGFLADRLWEAAISQGAAVAGSRRALLEAGLELGVIAIAAGWLLLHLTLAARIALPTRPNPTEPDARLWPRTVPRWILPGVALVTAMLAGSGGSHLAGPLQLMLDGVPTGVRDPLLEEDLGSFVGRFPLWSGLQHISVVLCVLTLVGVGLLYLAGGLIRRRGKRIQVSLRAKGQLAILLAVLALALAWGASLEPVRLAAGLRGPVRHSEFMLQTTMAYLQTGVGAAAAVLSLLWWIRVRGAVALLFWVMFGLARLGAALLPLHPNQTIADPVWRNEARRLDSIAFAIAPTDDPFVPSSPAGAVPVTLWDETVVVRAGLGSVVHRGWIVPPVRPSETALPPPVPVWLGLLDDGRSGAILAQSDDRTANSGAPLFWQAGAPEPGMALRGYRAFEPSEAVVRPGAPRATISRDSTKAGVPATGLFRRLILAWAWQAPAVLTASSGSRVGWRLDPGVRLRSVAPFAHWSTPRIRWVDNRLTWQSDGMLVVDGFPASTRIPWGSGSAALVRSSFMGIVDAGTGSVRIFQRDPADSLASAWTRINAPLVEPPSAIPPRLRALEPYPAELAMAQARVIGAAAWQAGTLEVLRSAGVSIESPGGGERVISYLRPGTQLLGAILVLRRTPGGDSLRLVRLDSLPPIESAAALRQRWERFPYEQMVRDSVLAAGATFRTGAVRYALTAEGPMAYQPAWSEGPAARPRLILVNLALGPRLGTGRNLAEALRNLRGEISPPPVGAGSQAILDDVRRWWQRADSALKRGDLEGVGRALNQLRELLERQP
jgi:hypothetical protein